MTDYSNGGERVVPTRANYVFYAHLSLYQLAVAHLPANARVLDAGCGTGFGAHLLREKGAAEVIGVDGSEVAIEFCREHFQRDGVSFMVADLGEPLPFESASFDFIFSSNTMEHIAATDTHLGECRRLLRPKGRLFAAMPAITNRSALEQNIRNIFHVTNLTPKGWGAKISRYFDHVVAFRHWEKGEEGGWPAICAKMSEPPDPTTRKETNFFLEEMSLDALNEHADVLNAVFVASQPRAAELSPRLEEHIPQNWAEGAIQARVRAEETAALRDEIDRLTALLAARSETADAWAKR